MGTLTFTNTYSIVVCCHDGCGLPWAMDDGFIRRRREDHAWFYCPNGHKQHYSGDNETEELRKQVIRMEKSLEAERSYSAQEVRRRQSADRRAAAARGQVTKIKNRITNGVCPVPGCKRSGLGADVVAHINTVHPDYHKHEENRT